ncbi:MAG TPA: hypothetical protein VD963_04345, partial [Phycisphaerales bacterium]|nr:hypothetical protein [Phycisphaerales bacterium]
MRNLLRNAVIVVVVVVIAIWSIIPPEKNLRLGRDLAGGVSLVYAVDVGPNEDAGATLSAVIGVLKERVDPTGLLEIAMVAQGNDRIEISMPLPSDLVKRLRAEFEERLREVTGPRLTEQDVRALVELPEPRRSERADELAAGDVARRQLLARLAAAHDARTAARAAYATAQEKADAATANLERARAEPVPDPRFVELNELAFRQASTAADQAAFDAARAEDEFDRALAESRSIAVSETELRRALSLSDEAERLRDTQTGEVVELPSPRREALDRIRTQHPDAAARIDAVIAAWDRYQQERRTLDDPQDLVRLLRGAGVLNFRIAVRSSSAEVPGLRTAFRKDGPRGQRLDRHGWYKINKIANWYDNVQGLRRLRELGGADFFAEMDFVVEEWDGQYYMLLHDSPGLRLTEGDGEWRLTGASVSRDDYGRPAISFTLDQLGGRRMGEL